MPSCVRRGFLIFLLLLSANAQISNTLENSYRGINFAISYLQDDIESQDISTITLSSAANTESQISCGQICLNKRGCVTAIYRITVKECILLKENLKSTEKYIQTVSQEKSTKAIILRGWDPCSLNPCFNGRKCVNIESGFICMCSHDERGHLCEIKLSGTSCLDIKTKFSNFYPKNGQYVLSSTNSNASFTAYCDMEFDEGGWTQVVKALSKTTDKRKFSFQQITSLANFDLEENYVMTSQFLRGFRNFSDFKQLRFECKSKITNTKIHIKTHSLTSIVDYMVGATDDRPVACGTFQLYEDDNSTLSTLCKTWRETTWGWVDAVKSLRLVDHPFFTWSHLHFLLKIEWQRFECDNYLTEIAIGDFWNVFVR